MVNGRRDKAVYVYNKTRETFVATEAIVADSYLGRLVGLLGRTKRWARFGAGLWIVPSHGIHTIGKSVPDRFGFSEQREGSGSCRGVRAPLPRFPRFPSRPPVCWSFLLTRSTARERRLEIGSRFPRRLRRTDVKLPHKHHRKPTRLAASQFLSPRPATTRVNGEPVGADLEA